MIIASPNAISDPQKKVDIAAFRYCKKQANLNHTLWINLFDYNYVQFHQSLRIDLTGQKVKFQKRYKEVTPAMKMGLRNSQLSWRYLLVVPIAKSG